MLDRLCDGQSAPESSDNAHLEASPAHAGDTGVKPHLSQEHSCARDAAGQSSVTRRQASRTLAPLIGALGLSACGGGSEWKYLAGNAKSAMPDGYNPATEVVVTGSTSGSTAGGASTATTTSLTSTTSTPSPLPPLPPSPPAPTGPVSIQEASRFLVSATFGPTEADLQKVSTRGIAFWLDEQLAMARSDRHLDYANRMGPIGGPSRADHNRVIASESWYWQALRGQDQLRQRVAFALSEIFVVSGVNSSLLDAERAFCYYLDILADNAFGNYRKLLEDISRCPAMGVYLSHLKNQKEDPATGRIPDQNYAREVMQLFSVGLWHLNPDGSRKLDASGKPIPTYGQEEISGMSKVFTGMSHQGDHFNGLDNMEKPLKFFAEQHSTSEKKIINGVVIPAGTQGDASLKIALDTLFNHPSTAPFISEQLIKRLVTSNPSRDYVARVSAVFANNGSGVRGDLRAVTRAILMDPEARNPAHVAVAQWGKLREPLIRFMHWIRAFNAQTPNGAFDFVRYEWHMWFVGQLPLKATSVFNWFRPDFTTGDLAANGMVGPEFQLTDESSIAAYANMAVDTAYNGFGADDYRAVSSYAPEIALAGQPDALIDRLTLLMFGGRISNETRTRLRSSIESIPASDGAGRARTAVALAMLSPEFNIQL